MAHSFSLRHENRSGALRRLALLVVLTGCALLAACGFKMKGVTPLPFDTLYTNIAENSSFGAAMRRAIVAASPKTRIVAAPADAQARLIQLANRQHRHELSIDADGRVEEYELTLEFVFQLVDANGHIILPTTSLRAVREVPYDDRMVQAKQSEITVVFQQMQQSMVDRVVRLLTAPDVAEAFATAEDQPLSESAGDPAPVSNDPVSTDPYTWDAPSMSPGGLLH